MASRHPPRFVVRRLEDLSAARRKRLLLLAAWLGSLVAVALVTWAAVSARQPHRLGASATAASGDAEGEALRQKVANGQRDSQVAEIAARELRRNLAERDEEISGLRADLAFYTRLVGNGGQRDGLKIQGARATAVRGSADAWNLVVTLTRSARGGDPVKGDLRLAVEGIQDNTVRTLEGPALGLAVSGEGLPFAFRYFQQVQGSFTLPTGFQPTRLRLQAKGAGQEEVAATLSWTDVTRNDEASDVQH
ncbi:DUF6776 family protein [Luteibacter sp. ME-Dv--P-043b]|jgi:hypothetical protein|uniref:DUF6776 family protein n=1 Tax=Luteibacter sp. ME-Dv--P-043b TaxID=3040291 RepID=UPI002552E854|nr:DUF6776 family protein [Luteibacter sp. ME-Dv--P-043b]